MVYYFHFITKSFLKALWENCNRNTAPCNVELALPSFWSLLHWHTKRTENCQITTRIKLQEIKWEKAKKCALQN